MKHDTHGTLGRIAARVTKAFGKHKQPLPPVAPPVHRLPVEIIQLILCNGDTPTKNEYRLRRVCLRWYHIMQGMQEFWSELDCFRRDGRYHLSLARSLENAWPLKITALYASDLRDVLPMSHRWVSLSSRSRGSEFLDVLRGIPSLPNLRSISFGRFNAKPPSATGNLPYLPRLRHADFMSFDGMNDVLSQLTHVTFRGFDGQPLGQVLKQMTQFKNVVHLNIALKCRAIVAYPQLPRFEPVEAPCLQKFSVRGGWDGHFLLRAIRPLQHAALSLHINSDLDHDGTPEMADRLGLKDLRISLGLWAVPQNTPLETEYRRLSGPALIDIIDSDGVVQRRISILYWDSSDQHMLQVMVDAASSLGAPPPRYVEIWMALFDITTAYLKTLSSIMHKATSLFLAHVGLIKLLDRNMCANLASLTVVVCRLARKDLVPLCERLAGGGQLQEITILLDDLEGLERPLKQADEERIRQLVPKVVVDLYDDDKDPMVVEF